MTNPHPTPVLGELETLVLAHFWNVGPADAKAVHRVIGQGRGITLNTIQSTLKRLFEKGFLDRDKVSHAHIYHARLTREAFQRELLSELVVDMMAGHAEAVVSAFVDLAESAGPEHLARLEALVLERRRQLAEKQ